MQIEIGERDKQNIARVFGRGQVLHMKSQVSDIKKKILEKVGFRKVVTRDYLATEVFHAMPDLLGRLQSAPIIPSFDLRKDRKNLMRVQTKCMTDRGHRNACTPRCPDRLEVKIGAVTRNNWSLDSAFYTHYESGVEKTGFLAAVQI